jgi:3-keto-5-aminohexanoate cleavage enzyme
MALPLSINFAPTGMVPTREMSPHVPLSVTEIVNEVRQAWDLGITLVHLHARDDSGRPTHDPAVYGEIIGQIRSFAPELVICVSLSGRNNPSLSSRIAPLSLGGKLKPDMGSLTLSSLNFSTQTSSNAPDVIRDLASEMLARGILPELEIFDLGMAHYARHLAGKGLIQGPHYANILLGNLATAQLDAGHLGLLLRDLPENTMWATGGLGRFQLPANQLGIALGGGVRVGLEDSLFWNGDSRTLTTNLALLQRIHGFAKLADRPLMSSKEFRSRLGLAGGFGDYGRLPSP